MARELTRGDFLKAGAKMALACAGAAVVKTSFSTLAFGAVGSVPEILVVIFLRGGCDGLSFVPPISGDDRGFYEEARPTLKIPTTGDRKAIPLDGVFGLHPALSPLYEHFQDRKLAIVHAAGLTSDSRSHFDAQAYMELGTPDNKGTTTGWIARHLISSGDSPRSKGSFPAVSVGPYEPLSFLSFGDAVSLGQPGDLNIGGPPRFQARQRAILEQIYSGPSWLHQAGSEALSAIDKMDKLNGGNFRPSSKEYPKSELGNRLKVLAQLIQMPLGLKVAALDMGGWDTHRYQGNGSEGRLASLMDQLAQGISTFYADLSASPGSITKRLTIVVMSEFGRRVKENANRGTDHGHGNIMLVLGDSVNGGRVFGHWDGLMTQSLYDRADLPVTTDYRQVLSEILVRRFKNQKLAFVFPGLGAYHPLGIVQGTEGGLKPFLNQAH